jgi:hypothetical protein
MSPVRLDASIEIEVGSDLLFTVSPVPVLLPVCQVCQFVKLAGKGLPVCQMLGQDGL